MKLSHEHIIPFSGLKDGSHEYDLALTDTFFEAIDYSEVRKGQVAVHLTLQKRPEMLVLEIELDGTVELECDRCSEMYQQAISAERKLVVNLNEDQFSDEDDLMTLPASTHELDLRHYLYEYVMLALPSRRVHPEDPGEPNGCDPVIIQKLEELAAQPETPDVQDDLSDDPRWQALKNIKFDQ